MKTTHRLRSIGCAVLLLGVVFVAQGSAASLAGDVTSEAAATMSSAIPVTMLLGMVLVLLGLGTVLALRRDERRVRVRACKPRSIACVFERKPEQQHYWMQIRIDVPRLRMRSKN
ncbi:MAG: hypothetical protein G01um101425_1006 [Candidatus Peregrinibacteria bacterium Gr01-1014_25]|nr:MAG: hypothetical protein G01um101425_1006 [Candidatus Peregrinibacteria bacterium Gr01-1014_25]